MQRVGRFLLVLVPMLVALTPAGAASAASPTFYVNVATGSNANACTEPAAPCQTIAAAVGKSEPSIEPARIEVAAGAYKEAVQLEHGQDADLTINGAGAGTEIIGPASGAAPVVGVSLAASGATLSNLRVVNQSGDTGAAVLAAAATSLVGVQVLVHDPKANGIQGTGAGSILLKGSEVTMAGGTEGFAVDAVNVPAIVEGSRLTVAFGSKAGALAAIPNGGLAIASSVVSVSGEANHAAIETEGGPISMEGVTIAQGDAASNANALAMLIPHSATVRNVRIEMSNPASAAEAIVAAIGSATFEHLQIGGAWTGPDLIEEGGSYTFADSRLSTNGAAKAPAILYIGLNEQPGLVFTRTVLQAAPSAPEVLATVGANATLDSSEVLGGAVAIVFDQGAGKARRLTVAASTIDAGEPGVADSSARDLELLAGATGSEAAASVQGSILMEQQVAATGGGGERAVLTCTNSDVPSQVQAEKGVEGTIACGAGSAGNAAPAPGEVFASPITAYSLNPSGPAVDSVPAGAIALPFGLVPSSTDLAGNPRIVDGNGDCVALQDRGALELQGHSATCPPPPAKTPAPSAPKPLAGLITALTVNPSSFSAAPRGATISKKKYGAKISYRDSQAATTTFTVYREEAGRTKGHSCKQPSKSNTHGRRCTILKRIGTFTHVDVAGANSFHFSGRLSAKKLAKGRYRLQAVASNAAGRGAAASAKFTIKE